MYTSQITLHTVDCCVFLFVGGKMKVINLEVYIYIYREKEAQMNNQSSIDLFPTVNNNTFCL
jgi:hypothetical protein